MVDFISNETKKIFYNCFLKQSEKRQIDFKKLRIILSLDKDGENVYELIFENELNGSKKIEKLAKMTFKEILDVKFDLKGYSLIAPPFIQKSIIKFATELGVPYYDVNVFCYPTSDKNEIVFCLFNKYHFVRVVSINELFNEKDIITE